MTTIYEILEPLGYKFEPAPRSNPRGTLYDPWRLVAKDGRTVTRGDSRDALELAAYDWVARNLCVSCGADMSRDEGRCTNRRCSACHRSRCTHGGASSPGHGVGRPTFEEWEAEVDREVARLIGVGLFSLPDVPTRDWYDDGVSVSRAAKRAIRNARES